MTHKLLEEIERCHDVLTQKAKDANCTVSGYLTLRPEEPISKLYVTLANAVERIFGRTKYTGASDFHVVLSLTGHRPDKLAGYDLDQDFYDRLRLKLVSIIEEFLSSYRTVECHSGMALGADTIWAQAILECKSRYGERVTFVADIPDQNQSSKWLEESKIMWRDLISHADSIVEYGQDQIGRSYSSILNLRNLGMVRSCDYLIAVYNGDQFGGTANAVRDGKRLLKKIIHIEPSSV